MLRLSQTFSILEGYEVWDCEDFTKTDALIGATAIANHP
jgi:hypothetical protein